MQLFVIGMHRSGTSTVSRLLNLMGIYFGPEGSSTGSNRENSKGFWERKDVRRLNDFILQQNNFDWFKISDFSIDRLNEETIKKFHEEASQLILSIDGNRPWFVKEPRFCLNFDLWKKHLEVPVCIYVYRHPVEVAKSLLTRNGFPIKFGLDLWEKYNFLAINSMDGIPVIPINYNELMSSPASVVEKLYHELTKLNVAPIRPISKRELEAFIDNKLYREKYDSLIDLNSNQNFLYDAMLKGNFKEILKKYSLSRYNETDLRVIENFLSYTNNLKQYGNVEDIILQLNNAKKYEELVSRHQEDTQINEKLKENLATANGKLSSLMKDIEKYKETINTIESKQISKLHELKLNINELKQQRDNNSLQYQLNKLKWEEELSSTKEELYPTKEELKTIKSRLSQISGQLKSKESTIKQLQLSLEEHQQVLGKKDEIIQNMRIKNRIKSIFKFNFSNKRKKIEVDENEEIIKHSSDSQNFENSIGNCLVVAWDMSHNPVGRAFLFADFLKRITEVKLIGPIFKLYGNDIWQPLKDYPISYDFFKADVFPAFLHQIKKYAQSTTRVDSIIICKPRLPSILLGMIIAKLHGSRFMLDIDDHELSFFPNKGLLTLEDLKNIDYPDLEVPYSEVWTRVSENLVNNFHLKIVSNTALQEKFGGEIVPHVRDENKFNPTKFDRDKIRKGYGYHKNDRVILFLGTPRKHKGFLNILNALVELGKPEYKLCIIGTITDKNICNIISETQSGMVQTYPDSSFSQLPELLSIADLICLLQDVESPIAEYQMPAKFSDALSMGIPILSTSVKPMLDLSEKGLVELIQGNESLGDKIDYIFNNYTEFKNKAVENSKKYFLSTHSYLFGQHKIQALFNSPLHSVNFPSGIDDLFKDINNRFYKKGRKIDIDENNINIVFFWKQNDSGLYGRRSDMLIKYLEQIPTVNKIIQFDAPIGHVDLLQKNDLGMDHKFFQNKAIYNKTKRRISGVEKSNKLFEYTFVYDQNAKVSPSLEDLKELGVTHLELENQYLNYILDKMNRHKIQDSNSVFWFSPTIFEFGNLLSVFNPGYIVADFIDDQRKWPLSVEQFNKVDDNYKLIGSMSDLTLCNSVEVQTSLNEFGVKAKVITNGLEKFDYEQVIGWDVPQELQRLTGPIIGYVGNLDPKRLDIALIKAIAQANKEWNIVLIGSAHMGSTEVLSLREFENIHLLGVIPYDESIKYIKHFDVGIIPHYDNEITQSMNPLKLYVYYTLGIQVVSTKVKGLDLNDSESVHIAGNQIDFIQCIQKCLSKTKMSQDQIEISDADTWKNKTEEIVSCIQKDIISLK